MVTRKEVLEFVENNLMNLTEERKNFSETDSLDKIELVIECEREYNLEIDENDVLPDFDTEMFVDFLMKKIKENES
jgi:acyl carrier protein